MLFVDDPTTTPLIVDDAIRGGVTRSEPYSLTFSVRAVDPDSGDVVSLDVAGLPVGAGATFPIPTPANPVESTFTWNPLLGHVGHFTHIFIATDNKGAYASHSLDIQVAAPPLPAQGNIAFSSHRDANWEIYKMNVDGSGQTRLTTNPAGGSQPDWWGHK